MKNKKTKKRYINFNMPKDNDIATVSTCINFSMAYDDYPEEINADFENLKISPGKFKAMLTWDYNKRWDYLLKKVVKNNYPNSFANGRTAGKSRETLVNDLNNALVNNPETTYWGDRVIANLATDEGAKKEWEYYLHKKQLLKANRIAKEFHKIKNMDSFELMNYTETFESIDEGNLIPNFSYGYCSKERRLEKEVKRRAIFKVVNWKIRKEHNKHYALKWLKFILFVASIFFLLATFAPAYFAEKSELLNTIYKEYSAFYCPATIGLAIASFVVFIKTKKKWIYTKHHKYATTVNFKYHYLPYLMCYLEMNTYPIESIHTYSPQREDISRTVKQMTHYVVSVNEGIGSPSDRVRGSRCEFTETDKHGHIVNQKINYLIFEMEEVYNEVKKFHERYLSEK